MSEGPPPESWQEDFGDLDTVPEGGIPPEPNGHLLAEQFRRRRAMNDAKQAMQPTADDIAKRLLGEAERQKYIEGGHA